MSAKRNSGLSDDMKARFQFQPLIDEDDAKPESGNNNLTGSAHTHTNTEAQEHVSTQAQKHSGTEAQRNEATSSNNQSTSARKNEAKQGINVHESTRQTPDDGGIISAQVHENTSAIEHSNTKVRKRKGISTSEGWIPQGARFHEETLWKLKQVALEDRVNLYEVMQEAFVTYLRLKGKL